ETLGAFVRGVEAIDEIVACYAISGGGDYLLKVVAEDMDAYAAVSLKKLSRLPGVKDSQSTFVLSTVKLEQSWPI
ncbi:MAG: Lrp/AsnC ligand binding domain-containing protein, partial [Pseudomonadota bacterium]